MPASRFFTNLKTGMKLRVFSLTLACVASAFSPAHAQDDSRSGLGLSRFFKLGSPRTESKTDHNHNHDTDRTEVIARSATPDRSSVVKPDSSSNLDTPFSPAVTSPGFGEVQNSRIAARSGNSGPITEADPILTRVGIGKSDSGSKFALFVQIYADGTVIDSEGVHRVPVSQIKQILAVIRGHDFSRIRGHCGQPSADFIENVQMVVYDRSMGRLRAHAFSYAGSPQGCDPSVAHLHKAVEDLIMQIATGRPVVAAETTTTVTSPLTAPAGGTSFRTQPTGPAASLSAVVESAQPIPVSPQPASIPAFPQGAVVPRLPAASIPSTTGNGTPELTLPK